MAQAENARPFAVPQSQQIAYIAEHAHLLDDSSRKEILSLIMMEVVSESDPVRRNAAGMSSEDECGADDDEGQAFDEVAYCNSVTGEVVIRLDQIKNAKVVEHIFHIIESRAKALNRPA